MSIHLSATVLAQAVNAVMPAASPLAAPASADAAQVAQFRDSLASVPPTSGADITGAVPASDTSATSSALAGSSTSLPTGPVSLGDTILKGLDQVRDHLKTGWASAVAPLQSGPVSAAGLLQAQAGLQQMGFETQLVGTVASKTSQSIDQLVKMQ